MGSQEHKADILMVYYRQSTQEHRQSPQTSKGKVFPVEVQMVLTPPNSVSQSVWVLPIRKDCLSLEDFGREPGLIDIIVYMHIADLSHHTLQS